MYVFSINKEQVSKELKGKGCPTCGYHIFNTEVTAQGSGTYSSDIDYLSTPYPATILVSSLTCIKCGWEMEIESKSI